MINIDDRTHVDLSLNSVDRVTLAVSHLWDHRPSSSHMVGIPLYDVVWDIRMVI